LGAKEFPNAVGPNLVASPDFASQQYSLCHVPVKNVVDLPWRERLDYFGMFASYQRRFIQKSFCRNLIWQSSCFSRIKICPEIVYCFFAKKSIVVVVLSFSDFSLNMDVDWNYVSFKGFTYVAVL